MCSIKLLCQLYTHAAVSSAIRSALPCPFVAYACRFTFDHVYDQDSTQNEVYDQTAKPLVLSTLQVSAMHSGPAQHSTATDASLRYSLAGVSVLQGPAMPLALVCAAGWLGCTCSTCCSTASVSSTGQAWFTEAAAHASVPKHWSCDCALMHKTCDTLGIAGLQRSHHCLWTDWYRQNIHNGGRVGGAPQGYHPTQVNKLHPRCSSCASSRLLQPSLCGTACVACRLLACKQ